MTKTYKQIYLVNGTEDESYKAFKERIHWEADILARTNTINCISYTITENEPPSVSIIPFRKQKIACISLWKSDDEPEKNLIKLQGFQGVYSVTEALPVAYGKNWEDGEKTPGVCLLTLFNKKKKIDYKTFIDRWHNGHTPLSLKIHPLWHYNRNVVEEKLSKNSINWDGIVEEHTRTHSELTNPFKFFGNPLIIIPRMLKVYTDTKSFLDYKTIETYLVSEYWLKSKT
jgi:hypothetical protein